ncbi:MAG TPA: alpha/beta hydrolase [Mycobacteriales bacterium]|nr:alpha/beta hydrolase [Mycobacteriales bacterium]
MRRDEARALTEVAAHGVTALVDAVAGVQLAVTKRAYDAIGPVAVVPRVAQHAVTSGVYAAVRGATTAAARVAGLAAQAKCADDDVARPLDESRRARWLAALSGAFGDALAEAHSPLAGQMSIRADWRAVPVTSAGLAAAFPSAHGRVVVFVHGLAGIETVWGAPSYGDRLEADVDDVTAVHLRYNTGRHISDNGHDLDALLDELVIHWPTTVTQLVLVGHSMGGLVIRSACHYADQSDHTWPKLVTDAFSLGSPHRGAPLERAVNVITAALGRVPEVAPLAQLVDRRSAGVKDLRYGYLLDDDWGGYDADEVRVDRGTDVALLPNVRQHFIAATLTPTTDGRLGALVGDLLVLPASAHGQAYGERRTRFPIERTAHVGGAHHLALLQHEQVYALLRDALTDSA